MIKENYNMVCCDCEREIAVSWKYSIYFQAVVVLHVIGVSLGVVPVGGVNNSDNQHLWPVKATNLTCTSNNFRNSFCWWISGDNVNATEVLQAKPRFSKWVTARKANHCEGNNCSNLYQVQSPPALYRVNTTNVYGSVVSETLTFWASGETVLSPPYDVRVTNLSESKLRMKWHAPPGDSDFGHFADRLDYRFQYKWEGENDTWKEVTDKLKATGSNGEFKLHGLTKPYGLYYVRLRAEDTLGRVTPSEYSDEAKGRTSEIAPRDPPSNFYCKADPSSDGEKRVVTLTWKRWDDPFKLNGEILGFNISVKQGDASKSISVEPNKTSHKIPDLDPSVHYKLSIQTVNSMGASPLEDCNIDPLIGGSSSYITVLIACGSTVSLIIVLVCIYQAFKKSMMKFPDITVSLQLTTDNVYFTNSRSREAEIFDELISHRLFVNLAPEDGVMTDEFDIGDKPRITKVPEDTIKMDAFESHPLLPGFSRHKRSRSEEFSFDEYGGGLASSPVSVGSGGSYLHIRGDDMAYRTMTKDGLSPVEKENTKGASGGDFDGFQELRPCPEDGGGEEGASNSPDAYTPMADMLSTHGASSKMGKQRGKAAPFGKRHPKESTLANEDNAAYASDGSVSNYTQQGFAASSTSQDDVEPPYVLGTNPTDSYSQVGLRDRVNLPSPQNQQFQNQAAGGLGPHDEYLRMGINAPSSDPHEVENEDSDFEDFPFILNTDILQNIPRPDSLQVSPNLNHNTSPLAAPSPLSGDTVTGVDGLQIPSSMRTESPNDDVFLRYVAVQGDSESLDLEDAETEQEGDGYVTQGMIPDILNPRADNRSASNVPGPPNLHSDYVDQEQLNSFPMPQAEAIPVANNHPPQQAGALSPNDYVTSEQVFDIVSPGPASNSCDETFTNSNNNCEGGTNSNLSEDETKDASEYMIRGNEEGVRENGPTDDPDGATCGYQPHAPPDQIQSLAPLSPPQNGPRDDFILNGEDSTHAFDLGQTDAEDVDENPADQESGKLGDTKGESDGGYVTHDEMQNIGRVASPTT